MSRGPGKVQRGVLDALQRGPLDTLELAGRVFQGQPSPCAEASTRRALRKLHEAGQVHCLGVGWGGARRWCLAEHRGLYARWKREGQTLGELLGPGRLSRLLTSAL